MTDLRATEAALRERVRDFIYDCTKDEFNTGWTLSAEQADNVIKLALEASSHSLREALVQCRRLARMEPESNALANAILETVSNALAIQAGRPIAPETTALNMRLLLDTAIKHKLETQTHGGLTEFGKGDLAALESLEREFDHLGSAPVQDDELLTRLRGTIADAEAMDLRDDELLSWDADGQPNLCIGDLRALSNRLGNELG